jgi:cobalamin-dependent methionine synthase I
MCSRSLCRQLYFLEGVVESFVHQAKLVKRYGAAAVVMVLMKMVRQIR